MWMVYMKENMLSGYYHESSLITVPPFLLRQDCSFQADIIDGSHTHSSFTFALLCFLIAMKNTIIKSNLGEEMVYFMLNFQVAIY